MYNVEERISEIDPSISLTDYILTDEKGEVLISVRENQKYEVDNICRILNRLNEDNKILRINNKKLSADVIYLAKLEKEK
jgi:hypothetical protein